MRCLYVLAKNKRTVCNSPFWHSNKKTAKANLAEAIANNYCSGQFKEYKVYRVNEDNTVSEVK